VAGVGHRIDPKNKKKKKEYKLVVSLRGTGGMTPPASRKASNKKPKFCGQRSRVQRQAFRRRRDRLMRRSVPREIRAGKGLGKKAGSVRGGTEN